MKNSAELNEIFEVSLSDCEIYGHSELNVLHIVLNGLVLEEGYFFKCLKFCGVNINDLASAINKKLNQLPAGPISKEIITSEELNGVMVDAWLKSQNEKSDTITVLHFISSLINTVPDMKATLEEFGFDRGVFFKLINHNDPYAKLDTIIRGRRFNDTINMSREMPSPMDPPIRGAKSGNASNKLPFLNNFGVNLNEKAKKGEIQRIIGRKEELERMLLILMRKKKSNPLIIGDAGVGKTTLAEALAKGIVDKTIHPYFENKTVYTLDLVKVVAGTKFRGEFEERMLIIIKELEENPNVIVFIDEIHQLVGSGSTQGSMDGSNILKPALSSGSIQLIGSTTNTEYKKHFENDKALIRRFQTIQLVEPTIEETIEILKGIKSDYEEFHHVTFSDDLVEEAVVLSGRLITDRYFPDKAIDMVDELCSYTKYKPNDLVDGTAPLREEIQNLVKRNHELNTQIDKAVLDEQYKQASALRKEQNLVSTQLKALELEFSKQVKQGSYLEASREDLLKIMSKITGASLESIDGVKKNYLSSLADTLKAKVVGQEKAVDVICDGVLRMKSRVKDPNKPLVYLFLGSTGIGKTLLVKEVAKEVYGSASKFIRINMSDYQDSYTVSNLTGSAKGYVGSDSGSYLYDSVKNNPNSIILLDEVEKAHENVFNAFLQIFDEGEAVDKDGNKISFRECIFVMTSNVGVKEMSGAKSFNIARDSDLELRKEEILKQALKNKFAPEVLNRITEIVTFNPINEENAKKIVDLELNKLNKRLSEIKKTVTVKPAVVEKILKEGFSTEFGARYIARTIERVIESPLSIAIINDNEKSNFVLNLNKQGDVIVK